MADTSKAKPTGQTIRLTDDRHVVEAQKVFTRMGERLELRAASIDRSNRLDAIMLESLCWQDPDALREHAEELPTEGHPTGEEELADTTITISSEFAMAEVRPVPDERQPRIEITAPKLGYDVELGASALAWVAAQSHETFTEWLAEPFGPGADDHEH